MRMSRFRGEELDQENRGQSHVGNDSSTGNRPMTSGDRPMSPQSISSTISRDHPPSQILESRTRSGLHTLCAMQCFVSLQEPKNIKDALKDPDWIRTMQEELEEFERNEVWRLVPRPSGDKSIIGTRWVFRNKVDDKGIVVRNRARLVA